MGIDVFVTGVFASVLYPKLVEAFKKRSA